MTFERDAAKGLSVFQLASARMEWLAERQKVVSANIANADVPEYKARDVTSFEDHLRLGDTRTIDAATSWDESYNGNTVVLEEQMLLSNEIEGNHRMATRLYGKGHALIALALGK